MFDAKIETIEPGRVTRYELLANELSLTFAKVIELWSLDFEFRKFYSDLLSSSPFLAFRWETPALTPESADRPFEFVLLNSPGFCSRPSDSETFASFFTDDDADFGIVHFDNLGGDATMIVPSPRERDSVYGHFASFIRGAPPVQVDAMWRVLGSLVVSRSTRKPVWISTAGGGVAWLHVRIDSRPKYYGYKPYKRVL